MKKKLLVNFVFFCIALNSIYAQVDTLATNSTEEHNQSIEKEQKHKQEYLDLNLREEKTLIKLGIGGLYVKYSANADTFSNGGLIGPNRGGMGGGLVFEQKVCPSFSFIFENGFSFGYVDKEPYIMFAGTAGFRYYYQIKKRINQSIGANNFHNNYFATSVNNIYVFQSYDFGAYSIEEGRITEWIFKPSLSISWGVQRRIGKWGFFDVSPYLGFNFGYNYSSNFYYGAKLQMGLAWGK